MKQEKIDEIPKKKSNIFGLLKPYKKSIITLLILTITSSALGLIIPKIIARAIDAYTQKQFIIYDFVLEFGIIMILIFIFTYIQNIFQIYTSEKVAKDLREKITDKVSRQDYLFIEKITPAKLLTNLTSDIDSIKLFISQAIVSLVSSVIIVIGAAILLFMINWKLAFAVLTIVPIIGVLFFLIFRKIRVLFLKTREIVDWLNKVINESILGSTLIRVLNSKGSELDKFHKANSEAQETGLKILKAFATLIPLVTFIASLATLVILTLGGYYVINSSMSLGDFTAFNSYVALLIFPILIIGIMSNLIAQASASFERISEVLNIEDRSELGGNEDILDGDIKVENLQIIYLEKPALKDISFKVKPRSKTAIIGPTAAGKTQLLYALIGLIKAQGGSISYNNKLIESYNPETLYKQIGFVFQDSIIFNLTVRENIAFSETIPEENLEKALITAEVKEFIDNLPEGLETVVSERGSSLSGGQKQRIMLARALALNPKILLLDDFTARVDSKTERKILDNISKNYPDMTIISVTQKISSIEKYDQIILMMEGEIIAKGLHNELLETCPEYIQIYNSQKSTNSYE
ncbi:MAG: ABC transporter ATP-binding protein [Candidatus Gracilibacteria bacterium]|nr:ABC transporter ATP-binding protein [Candidatus Gracilibacteria bacterium]MDD2908696.1 ABC transporter ATP-binding protein [Candidatus Gracilibacteria bacterium]